MSTTRTARRRLALAALPVAGLVGLLGSTACSRTDDAAAVSASGTRTSAPTQIETSVVPATAPLTTLPQAPTSVAPAPAPTSGGGSPATTTSGGGAPAPTTAPAPSTLPVVTGIHGPATADCESATGLVTITVNYTAANAKYVEYLAPSSDRPGADAATGSVMFNYDCTQASQVFKIRAFNEFAGSDAKDPSPYVSVTVQRKLVGPSTTTTAP